MLDLDKYKANFSQLMAAQDKKYADYYKNPSHYYVHPFRIAGNLYYVGDQKVCQHLVDTGDGLILFDTGFPHTAHLQIQAIWELGFNPRDIKYVIHSHEHFDHIGAANEFKGLYGSKLLISKRGAEIMERHPEQVLMQGGPCPHASIFAPDQTLEDGEVLSLGNTSIRCVETPGHSDGVMTFFFDILQEDTVYHVGYFGGVGFNTLYPEALRLLGRPVSAQQEFMKSLERVRHEAVDINLGNHPKQNSTLEKREQMLAGAQSNPFINPAEWGEFIDTLTEKFRQFILNDTVA